MADRRNWLGGFSLALALCAALPAAAQDRRVFSAASDDPAPDRAGTPEDYAWIDRADALWDAIGDSPPDFAFTFEDVEPWAWQLRDGHVILVEEAAEGIRSYYFEPRSNVPFLAVEPGASFAFEDGELVMAYGPDGTALGEIDGMARYEQGMALFDRARQLKQAMRPQSAQPVDTGAWVESSLYLGGFLDQWHQGFAASPEWRAQRDTAAARDWRYRLQAERSRRQALGQGFRRWREGGFQGPPPARWRHPGDVRPGQPPRQGVRPRPERPEAGRPDRPRPPGRPGARPEPQVPALPPVISAPRPNRPDRPMIQPGPTPGTPNVARPPRPWGSPRPGWNRPRPVPQPGAAPEPGSSGVVPGRQPRPQGRPGWMHRPPLASPAPAGSGEAGPSGRPVRPEGRPGWSRRPPISTPAPSAPSGVTQPAPVRPDRPAPQSRAPEAAPVPPPPPRAVPEARPEPAARPSRPLRPVRVPNED